MLTLVENKNDKDKDELIESLVTQYGDDIVRLAYTYVKHKGTAEDIAQEVFIRCYQKLDTFRGESSYKTWLYRVTINKCKDEFKSWSFRNLVFSNNWFNEMTYRFTGESAMLEKEESLLVSKAVLSLPVKYREVIILRYYEELSVAEIASLLSENQNTLKSRIQKAYELLRKKLEGVGFDGKSFG